MKLYLYLRTLFFPLSFIYRIIVSVRNRLFDKQLINIKSFNLPVISVGNLTAGGTGKTPFIIYLLDVLEKSFKKPAVVTRGYGRKTKGCVVVSDGQGRLIPAIEGGDEPLLIARRHPQVVVIASEKRAEGIQYAIENFGCDIIFLDDAFQHRFVRRDCDIVLINAREGRQGTKMLPQGNLREPLPNVNRADIVVITKSGSDENNSSEQRIRRYYDGPLYYADFRGDLLTQPDFKTTKPLSDLYDKKISAFCGIAHPEEFYNELKSTDLDMCSFLSFPDHHYYSEREIYNIIKSAKNADCDTFITTEKDMVRLNRDLFTGMELLALRLTVTVTSEFNEIVRTFIDKAISY